MCTNMAPLHESGPPNLPHMTLNRSLGGGGLDQEQREEIKKLELRKVVGTSGT